ncbi:hypothetical protein ACVGW2_01970, partial [Enterobacter intestinihominis]
MLAFFMSGGGYGLTHLPVIKFFMAGYAQPPNGKFLKTLKQKKYKLSHKKKLTSRTKPPTFNNLVARIIKKRGGGGGGGGGG